MKLDYGTQVSFSPIKLGIGTIRKPTLREISELGFDVFGYYQAMLKLSPSDYYSEMQKRNNITVKKEDCKEDLYDILCEDKSLANEYLNIFNFFFLEYVYWCENTFIIVKEECEDFSEINSENIKSIVSKDNFLEVIDILSQVGCVSDKNDKKKEEKPKFKNKLAERLYMRMKESEKEQAKIKKVDMMWSIPNIVSSVANKHPSLNYVNIWDITLFQLIDSFERLQINSVYDMNSMRVSVWGDEKNSFDSALWYKYIHNNTAV